jgi:hypothetical protein
MSSNRRFTVFVAILIGTAASTTADRGSFLGGGGSHASDGSVFVLGQCATVVIAAGADELRQGVVPCWQGGAAPPCPGDIDGDNAVSLSDLSTLLANFGTTGGATLEDGDLNGDGAVNLADLSVLLSRFGTNCP